MAPPSRWLTPSLPARVWQADYFYVSVQGSDLVLRFHLDGGPAPYPHALWREASDLPPGTFVTFEVRFGGVEGGARGLLWAEKCPLSCMTD
jgi:hypothetical protein